MARGKKHAATVIAPSRAAENEPQTPSAELYPAERASGENGCFRYASAALLP
jgi:hypothetical protein